MSINRRMVIKMLHMRTIESYSAIKKNDVTKSVGKWMDLENITLCEATQTHKDKFHGPSDTQIQTSVFVCIEIRDFGLV